MSNLPLRIKRVRCAYCTNTTRNPQTKLHDRCPGAVRMPDNDRVFVCSCCAPRNGMCTTCGNRAKDEVDPITWYCLDRHACAARVQQRTAANPVFKQLQEARLEAAVRRRDDRRDQERIRSGIDPDDPSEVDSFAQHRSRPPARPRTGKCLCCDGATKGGRFLPGHDAKLVSRLLGQLDQGDASAWEQVLQLGWSGKPAFRKRAPKTGSTAVPA